MRRTKRFVLQVWTASMSEDACRLSFSAYGFVLVSVCLLTACGAGSDTGVGASPSTEVTQGKAAAPARPPADSVPKPAPPAPKPAAAPPPPPPPDQASSSEPPATRPAESSSVVYNVVFPDPAVTRVSNANDLNRLEVVAPPNKETSVDFSLGPRSSESVLGTQERIAPDLWEGIKESDADLLVSMSCQVCSESVTQRKVVHWNASGQRSDVAKFQFTPVADWQDIRPNGGALSFWVSKDGNRFDTISVPVSVKELPIEGQTAEEPVSPSPSISPDVKAPEASRDREREVDLVIQTSMINNTLFLAIIPESRRLKAVWPPENDNLKNYRTNLTQNRITQYMRENYVRLYISIAGANQDVQDTLRRIPGSPTPITQSLGNLSAGAARQLTNVLAGAGTILYAGLFSESDGPELRQLWGIVEQVAVRDSAEPLRIRVDTPDANAVLPWHWFHNGERIDDDFDTGSFWGMKFELSYGPAVNGLEYPGPIEAKNLVGLFGGWGDESDPDVMSLSENEWMDLVEPLTGSRPIEVVQALGEVHTTPIAYTQTSKEFRDILTCYAADLNLIWVYLHGSSGSHLRADAPSTDIIASRLMFGRSDWLTLEELRLPSGRCRRQGVPPLIKRPIVFLNGCETGTAGFGFSNLQTLPDVFILRRAGAVIATDASVERYFAYNFGKAIIQDLYNGKRLARAVLDQRRLFLRNQNNPMGLLYSYYGSPGARLVRQQ